MTQAFLIITIIQGILLIMENLTKRYGQHVAVDAIDFTVKREILIPAQPAGKTTTMNILMIYFAQGKP